MSSEPMHKLTVKVGDALRTVQADTHDEFVDQLEMAKADLQACYDLLTLAKAVGNVAQTPAPATTATAAPSAPASFSAAAAKQCMHGEMVARTGSGAKGPWKGWFCPSPKGTPDQCSPDFVNRGTPEWNNFPA
jgi:hypothetical protein